MATLATQTIGAAGRSPTYTAAAGGGDKAAPGKGRFLHVKNASVAPITVTIATPGTSPSGLAIADRAVVVAASGEQMIPLLDEYRASDGLAVITYSGVTTLTVAALQI